MSIVNILKKNIPEFQQDQESLDGYLEAAGEFLDGTKEAIENLDNLHDYKNGTQYFMENSLLDRGFAMPSRIDEDTKRRVLRDMAEIHLKTGTLDGILHAVRMAGITPEVRVGWLPSPELVRTGFIQDPVSLITSSYDITRYVYTDMLYGDAVSTDAGVFFEGYRYNDTDNLELIGPLAIFGERYEDVPTNPVAVAKTPYIIVRFEEGNATLVTDPEIDPETGEIYEYSTSEQFELLNETLKYFLSENNRPTTMRIIIIVSQMPLDDEMTISETDYTDTHTYNPDAGDNLTDSVSYSEITDNEAVIDFTVPLIGEEFLIGPSSPYTSRFFLIDGIVIGDEVDEIKPELETAAAISDTTYHRTGAQTFNHPVRGGTSFQITPTQNLRVYGVRGDDYANRTLVYTINAGVATTVNTNTGGGWWDVMQFEYFTTLTADNTLTFTYSAYSKA